MNPAVVLLNKESFGKDAREFMPERWMESEVRNHAMDKVMTNFGAGRRTMLATAANVMSSAT
jgi:hypothetical protein